MPIGSLVIVVDKVPQFQERITSDDARLEIVLISS
jgi:hypothetical protein